MSQARAITNLEDLLRICQPGQSTDSVANIEEVVVVENGSKLAYCPPAMLQLTSLVKLNLSGNSITQIPFNICNLVNLQVANLSRNSLTSLPSEISFLSALTDLDASRNQISAVSVGLCNLANLKFLNLMGNQLTALPEEFGQLSKLRRLGLKSNTLTELPASFTQLTDLVELFMTDNMLQTFPEGFGNLKSLVKLQASFNSFTALPADLFHLPSLELCRVAVCAIASLPANLLQQGAHKLAWFSLSGNPVCPAPPKRGGAGLPHLDGAIGAMAGKLGDGASGEVFAATLEGREVAVKVFRADVSPDGRTEEEVALSCFVEQPNLVRVRGLLQEPHALVMDLVHGQPMADKPVFEPLLRCRWQQGISFTVQQVVSVASGVAEALRYLHSHCICHGDVYAHNILVDAAWTATLVDFGAAFCYPQEQKFWEAMEVRAFGLFLKDLVQRIEGGDPEAVRKLQDLVSSCADSHTSSRVDFQSVCSSLTSV